VRGVDSAPADGRVYPEGIHEFIVLGVRDKIEHVPGRTDEQVRWRIAHLTTADISLALLLSTELEEGLRAGHELIGMSAPGPYVERVEALGVRHVPLPALTRSWDPGADLRAFWDLWRTLRSLNLDVLHTHNPKTGVMGRIAGRLAGVPVVVNTCHGLWATPQDSLAKRTFVYGLEALAARFSDYELFQNAQDERTLRRFLKPGRHRVVGNGIDLERFRFDAEGRARVRAEWGVGDGEILVGTVGRRVRDKGLEEYAVAAHALRGQARFVWVGPDDDTDAAPSTRIDSSAVQFIPERTDMPAVYSAFDVFVLASYREGFSRASMEAAACGRPMVLSDIRGCREIGTDGVHVKLVPPRDAAALSTVVSDLINDPTLRADLGAAGQERAQTAFNHRQVARHSFMTYEDAARSKRDARLCTDHRTVVLHVLPLDRRRGAQVYAGQLRDRLSDRETQRHLALTLFDGPEGALRPDIRLNTPGGPLRRVADPRAVWRLWRFISWLKPDVVVAHGGEPLKYVVPGGNRAQRVYYKVGLSTSELARPLRRRLFSALASKADRAVGVSEDVAEQLRATLDVAPDRVSIIPNGRDPDLYHPGLAAERGFPEPLVLFIGELEPGKRPGLFIEVIERLRQMRIPLRAAMVGDGPLHASMARRAANNGISMLGVRSDVPDLLRQAELVLVTSADGTEGMPGVVVEAGLSGVPVVSTLAAGVRDVVADGVTGYVVKDGDVQTLASRAASVLSDPDLRRAMGEAARASCADKYSLSSSADRWETLIDELCGPRNHAVEPA
jgi:glycosyltransferase involved in cell wall biosynthesis